MCDRSCVQRLRKKSHLSNYTYTKTYMYVRVISEINIWNCDRISFFVTAVATWGAESDRESSFSRLFTESSKTINSLVFPLLLFSLLAARNCSVYLKVQTIIVIAASLLLQLLVAAVIASRKLRYTPLLASITNRVAAIVFNWR